MRQVVYEQYRSLKLHLKISTRLRSTKDFQYLGGHFQCFEIPKMLADNCSLSFARYLGRRSAKIRLWGILKGAKRPLAHKPHKPEPVSA